MLELYQTLHLEDVPQPTPRLHQIETTPIGLLLITTAETTPMMMMVMEVGRRVIFQEVLMMIHLIMKVLATNLTTLTTMYNTI